MARTGKQPLYGSPRRVGVTLACTLLLLGLVGLECADAQILRTPVPLPPLPKLDLPVGADAAIADPYATLSPARLEELRVLRLRALVREHRDVLEVDAHGAPVVRGEILAWSPAPGAVENAVALGYVVGRRTPMGEVGEIVVLLTPAGMTTRAALAQLRRADPAGTYEFNHVYFASGMAEAASASLPAAPTAAEPAPLPVRSPRVGLIDAGMDGRHPAFDGLVLHRWGCHDSEIPSAHGTAVASLLAGRATDFRGAAAGAELYAADVFCGAPTGGAVDAIIAAIGWLLRERVPVINVSLVGPPNGVLEQAVRVAIAKGSILVAAVGNDGPAAPPAYPASYPGVIAVTAVDAHRRLLLEAGRALHVDVAAPGADMLAATPPSAFAAVRGTSFASPLVAGLLALELPDPDPAAARLAIDRMEARAALPPDRGAASHYGKGLVGETLRVPAPSARDGRKPPAGSF